MQLISTWLLLLMIHHGFFLHPIHGHVTTSISRPSVVVIGGGAAGYFSAIECARVLKEGGFTKYDITVLEAGKDPLSKVLISGGGRCNVMHNPMKGANEIAKGYPRGSKELLGPLNVKVYLCCYFLMVDVILIHHLSTVFSLLSYISLVHGKHLNGLHHVYRKV